jgi:protein-tyrosine phosphatase
MIDLHCHLLPGVDDGPDTLEEAVALCRHAVAAGITHSIVTPHVHPGRYENNAASISTAVTALRHALQQDGVPLQLGYSGEVRISPEILPMVMAGQIPFHGTWNGQQVLLLEFPHSHILPGSDKLVRWLLQRHIIPMIAHPERNKDVMRDISRLHEFVQMGCLMQVTAGSLSGRFGEVAEQRAKEIVSEGWATVLASDAHNVRARPPELADGVEGGVGIIGRRSRVTFSVLQSMENCCSPVRGGCMNWRLMGRAMTVMVVVFAVWSLSGMVADIAAFRANAWVEAWSHQLAQTQSRQSSFSVQDAEWQEAHELATLAVRLAPMNADYREGLARVHEMRFITAPIGSLEAQASREMAIAAYKDAIKLRPTWPYAYAALAYALVRAGGHDAEVERVLAEAARLGPWEPQVMETIVDIGLDGWYGYRQRVE